MTVHSFGILPSADRAIVTAPRELKPWNAYGRAGAAQAVYKEPIQQQVTLVRVKLVVCGQRMCPKEAMQPWTTVAKWPATE